jgi:hypothetical protein
MAHTPGPWRFTSRNLDGVEGFVSRIPFAIEMVSSPSAVAPIADVCDQPQAADNARLIASAPDLLAALQALSALNDNYAPFGGEIYQDRIERAWDNARAAIARATQPNPANPLRGED